MRQAFVRSLSFIWACPFRVMLGSSDFLLLGRCHRYRWFRTPNLGSRWTLLLAWVGRREAVCHRLSSLRGVQDQIFSAALRRGWCSYVLIERIGAMCLPITLFIFRFMFHVFFVSCFFSLFFVLHVWALNFTLHIKCKRIYFCRTYSQIYFFCLYSTVLFLCFHLSVTVSSWGVYCSIALLLFFCVPFVPWMLLHFLCD